MQNGLYKVEFQTPLGAGAGVVFLEDGKLRGGDSAIFYTGTYTENGNVFSANVKTARHSQGLPSVFGRDSVQIAISGNSNGNSANLSGKAAEVANVTFSARLSRIGD